MHWKRDNNEYIRKIILIYVFSEIVEGFSVSFEFQMPRSGLARGYKYSRFRAVLSAEGFATSGLGQVVSSSPGSYIIRIKGRAIIFGQ